jgi:hypothetical protein
VRDDVESVSPSGGLREAVRRHPAITAILLGCTVLGAVAGFCLLGGDWSALRRIAAGGVAGAGFGLLLTATKMIG